MIYSKRIKTTMCLAATITMFFVADFNIADAVFLSTEKGIAGIALSLDKFYMANNNSTMNIEPESTKANVFALSSASVADNSTTVEAISEETREASKEEAKEEPIEETQDEEEKKPVSKYADTGISIAKDYVNIRKKGDTESEILGKLYKGSAATLLSTEGEWLKIKSGSVTGYINSEFLATGFDAEEIVDKYATKLATVTTTTLKVREKKSAESECLTMVPTGETYVVLKEYDKWVKIVIDDGEENQDNIKGYVSKKFVEVTVEFKEAISTEEEQAKLAQEEAAKQAEQEQLEKLQQQSQNKQSTSKSSSNSSSKSSSKNKSTVTKKNVVIAEDPSGSGNGSEIASYALNFVGNPYVYGGTSLTNGTDCSGFTQSVYRSYGYNIPRDSRSQAAGAGSKVSLSSLKSGDLVFYTGSSGSVSHVALYIGGGQVVHASTERTGIKVSNVNYRTPYMARRVIN